MKESFIYIERKMGGGGGEKGRGHIVEVKTYTLKCVYKFLMPIVVYLKR